MDNSLKKFIWRERAASILVEEIEAVLHIDQEVVQPSKLLQINFPSAIAVVHPYHMRHRTQTKTQVPHCQCSLQLVDRNLSTAVNIDGTKPLNNTVNTPESRDALLAPSAPWWNPRDATSKLRRHVLFDV